MVTVKEERIYVLHDRIASEKNDANFAWRNNRNLVEMDNVAQKTIRDNKATIANLNEQIDNMTVQLNSMQALLEKKERENRVLLAHIDASKSTCSCQCTVC